MSLPHGLLGLLGYGSGTGYELTKIFESSLNHFWHAQNTQIYRELNRMEEKGWVTSQSVIQDKRPNKRVYSVTETGRKALVEWLHESAPLFENPHEPLLMRVFFGANTPEVTLGLLKSCKDMCLASLEGQFAETQAAINREVHKNPDTKEAGMYWQMTRDFGIAYAKAVAEWAQECIDKLENHLEDD